VRLPNGVETTWSVVRHPGAACVLPIDGDDALLVRTYRPHLDLWMLELPGGGVEPGEPPVNAARRELREEAGFTAEQLVSLGAYRSVQGFSDFVLHYFVAIGLTHVGQQLEANELGEPVRVPFAELVAMLRRGELEDSQIPVTLFLALLHGALPRPHHAAMLEALGQ
jgi:ADP-ribose pyrophosphatase